MRILFLVATLLLVPRISSAQDPSALIKSAVEYWRGTTSYTKARMTVHRPDWERTMGFESWTKGEDDSLVRFTEPSKDAGNASLMLKREMWSYAPRVNKVIKIPPSMMNQSWMGSDFSHSDLAKQTDIIDQYTHRLLGTESHEGKKLYVIEAIPKETSAIVWGKEILKVREDYLIIERSFFDQEMKLVKKLTAREIAPSGKKLVAKLVRMEKAEVPDEWTEVYHSEILFEVPMEDTLFTLSHLSNPRR